MEWESEDNLEFLREDFRKNETAGTLSFWDQYLMSNACEALKLREVRISQNILFAQRCKERLANLAQAEESGVLVIKK